MRVSEIRVERICVNQGLGVFQIHRALFLTNSQTCLVQFKYNLVDSYHLPNMFSQNLLAHITLLPVNQQIILSRLFSTHVYLIPER